ncbi:hypothetical protein QFZ24_004552 [Streptomyces phaeochromogenes]|nr:hypothetical protein [Streptomyces phaeochromogenes]
MIADARTRRRREADAVHAVELCLARAERARGPLPTMVRRLRRSAYGMNEQAGPARGTRAARRYGPDCQAL